MIEKVPPSPEKRLVLSHQAYLGLDLAEQTYTGLKRDHHVAFRAVPLALLRTDFGKDPVSLITEITAVAKSGRDNFFSPAHLYSSTAEILAKSGDTAGAFSALQQAERVDESNTVAPYGYLQVAKFQSQRGEDVSRALNEATRIARIGGADALHHENQFAAIGKSAYELGLDPEPWLNEGLEMIRQDNEKYGYVAFAETYADIGDFDTAVQMISRIRSNSSGDTREARNDARIYIARKQASSGQFNSALILAAETGSAYLKAEMSAEVARLAVENNSPEAEQRLLVALVRVHIHENDVNKKHGKKSSTDIARLYGILADARATLGDFPRAAYQEALDKVANAENNEDKVEVINEIAEGQAKHGLDLAPAVNMAIETADDIFRLDRHTDFDDGMGGGVNVLYQMGAYANIGHTGIHVGRYELVDVILPKLDKAGVDMGFTFVADEERMELLTERSRTQLNRGFTPDQLKNMPADIRAQLLSSQEQPVQQAVAYFTSNNLLA